MRVGVLRPGVRNALDEEDPDLGIANDELDIAAAVEDDEDERVCMHARHCCKMSRPHVATVLGVRSTAAQIKRHVRLCLSFCSEG